MRRIFVAFVSVALFFNAALAWVSPLGALAVFAVVAPIICLGLVDYFQQGQAIRRNFPLLGRMRYLFEAIRPEINQYFVESNSDGVPFSREQRSVVYQRAKKQVDTLPFGTQQDVNAAGYEWVAHSLAPTHVDAKSLRVPVGGPDCKQPYAASLLNVSAMSYGALSKNAVLALNGAAMDGDFAHNTGEGGLSPYHLAPGGALIWQIGTGYFSCRDKSGRFDAAAFTERANRPQVKMIEIKLSQGAKPSHGGILPARKVTEEISHIRGVPMGVDVLSPPAHSAFATPTGLLEFTARLRELANGKPVGFKLCLGREHEFLAICKAMIATGITPDFIAVDGGEGGTGAAPLEFSNHVGAPGIDSLVFVHNALVGFGLRDRVKIFSSGKVTTGFGMLKRLALGADAIYSARAMMLALGCIQALRCNTNHCPTGVATQDPSLVAGLVVADKRTRVKNFHAGTIASLAHMLEAMGVKGPSQLRPHHVFKRVTAETVRHYGEIYDWIGEGELVSGDAPARWQGPLAAADKDSFEERPAAPRAVAARSPLRRAA